MKISYLISVIAITIAFSSCQKEELIENDETSTKATTETTQLKYSFCPMLTLDFNLETRNHNMGGFANHETTIFKKNIWLVGGDNSHTDPWTSSSQVWKSHNGKDWKLITSGLFEKRRNHSLIVFNDKMWLIGGINNSNEILSDIWNTTDGVHWNRVKSLNPLNDIGQNNSVVFNNKIFVFKANGNTNQAVWSSTNGENWHLETDNAFSARTHYKTVVHNKMIYIFGGLKASGLTNEVWASKDGIVWVRKSPSGSIFEPRLDHTATSYKDKIWVVGGQSWNSSGERTFYGDIWYSSDMIKWCRYDNKNPIQKGIEAPSVLVYEDRLWIFGGYRPDTSLASILSSSIYSITP